MLTPPQAAGIPPRSGMWPPAVPASCRHRHPTASTQPQVSSPARRRKVKPWAGRFPPRPRPRHPGSGTDVKQGVVTSSIMDLIHLPETSAPILAQLRRAYRNEIPQHHHRDSPSGRVACGPCVLSGQHGCGCGKFGTKRPQVQILSPRPVFPQARGPTLGSSGERNT